MKFKSIEYFKNVNKTILNPKGLKIFIYKFFYYIELINEPQIYFSEKTKNENKKFIEEVINFVIKRNQILNMGKPFLKNLKI